MRSDVNTRLSRKNNSKRREKIVAFVILLFVCIIWAFPLIYMLGVSVREGNDFLSNPARLFPTWGNWTLENFAGYIVRDGQMDNFIYWIINSTWSTAAIVVLTLVMDLVCAYAVVFIRFKGQGLFMRFIYIWYAVPGVIGTAASFSIYATIIRILNLAENEAGLYAFIYAWMIIPGTTGIFNFLLMRNFFASIPQDIIDSAKSDGANNLHIFFKIVMPLAKSTIMLIILFTFVGAWNSLQGPQLLFSVTSNRHFETLTVALAGYTGGSTTSFGIQMSSAAFALIPSVIVFLITQDKMIDGLATTGIKR
jgi:multiple sugar transport system permease protein